MPLITFFSIQLKVYKNIFSPLILLFNDRSINLDDKFFSILVVLLPIVLITGRAIPDIFLSLTALYFLFKSIRKKLWTYYQNPIVIFFLLFCFYGIVRSIFTKIALESLANEGSIFYLRYIFFSLGVWYLLDNNPHLSKSLLIILIFCLTIVSLDAYIQYFTGVNSIGIKKYSASRLNGFMGGNEPVIGRYISYLSIITFGLICQNFKLSKKIITLSILFLTFCETITFLSGERAPFFSLTLFILLILIYLPNFKIQIGLGIFFSIFLIGTSLLINPEIKIRMIEYTLYQISETSLPFLPYSAIHEEHYLSALKIFNDNLMFGSGINSFKFLCDKSEYIISKLSCTTHPHNIYIQILSELGIVGFMFIFIFFMYLFIKIVKQFLFLNILKKKKPISLDFFIFYIILFVYWWPLIPTMSFYNNWNNVFIMLPLGFFMKYLYGKSYNGTFNKS